MNQNTLQGASPYPTKGKGNSSSWEMLVFGKVLFLMNQVQQFRRITHASCFFPPSGRHRAANKRACVLVLDIMISEVRSPILSESKFTHVKPFRSRCLADVWNFAFQKPEDIFGAIKPLNRSGEYHTKVSDNGTDTKWLLADMHVSLRLQLKNGQKKGWVPEWKPNAPPPFC